MITIPKSQFTDQKEYRKIYSRVYREKKKEEYTCGCGVTINILHRSHHEKTKTHKEYIEFKDYPEYWELLEKFNNETEWYKKYHVLSKQLKKLRSEIRNSNISSSEDSD